MLNVMQRKKFITISWEGYYINFVFLKSLYVESAKTFFSWSRCDSFKDFFFICFEWSTIFIDELYKKLFDSYIMLMRQVHFSWLFCPKI